MTAYAASLRDLPPFAEFLDDLAVLGVTIEQPGRDNPSYAVIPARSNPRWWLVPIGNRAAAAAGIEMLQPVSPAARAAKTGVALLARFGPHALLGKGQVAFSGIPNIAEFFGDQVAHVAYFTGTDGPHRKSAIQFMDKAGGILGYGKISRSEHVRRYVRHEAQILEKVSALSLATAEIPSVVSFADEVDHSVLVTDSRKSAHARVDITLTSAHRAFLDEVASCTGAIDASHAFDLLEGRIVDFANNFDAAWAARLHDCRVRIAPFVSTLPVTLAHGDFTPWNVFAQDGAKSLYVFDWEYAEAAYPAGYDQAHFVLSTQTSPNAAVLDQLIEDIAQASYGGDEALAAVGLLFALALHAVFYINRAFEAGQDMGAWAEAPTRAQLIDRMLARVGEQ